MPLQTIFLAIAIVALLALAYFFFLSLPLALLGLAVIGIIIVSGMASRFGMTRLLAIAFFLVLAPVAFGIYQYHEKGQNPDPDHHHADFAVWIGGKQLDFSAAKYMTTEAEEEAAPSNSPKKYFHLHDGNGHVIHRHKPGMPLSDFFASMGFNVASNKQGGWCWYAMQSDKPFVACESKALHLFVNGAENHPANADSLLSYVFQDGDRLLLTDATDPAEVRHELSLMTDDACLYSRTCPGRGPAPTENCIADPTIPCRIQ